MRPTLTSTEKPTPSSTKPNPPPHPCVAPASSYSRTPHALPATHPSPKPPPTPLSATGATPHTTSVALTAPPFPPLIGIAHAVQPTSPHVGSNAQPKTYVYRYFCSQDAPHPTYYLTSAPLQRPSLFQINCTRGTKTRGKFTPPQVCRRLSLKKPTSPMHT